METHKFNFPARRKEWPLMEEVMNHFSDNQMITLLKSHAHSSRRGSTITLYKDGKAAMSASVMFGLYAPTYRFDALHILLDYLKATNASVDWDAVSFSDETQIIARNDKSVARLDPVTSDIAHYARIGLRESLVQISALQTGSKINQVFNALLANTAIVEVKDPDVNPESMEAMLERAMRYEDRLNTRPVLRVIKPDTDNVETKAVNSVARALGLPEPGR